jgi:hypothetical protein
LRDDHYFQELLSVCVRVHVMLVTQPQKFKPKKKTKFASNNCNLARRNRFGIEDTTPVFFLMFTPIHVAIVIVLAYAACEKPRLQSAVVHAQSLLQELLHNQDIGIFLLGKFELCSTAVCIYLGLLGLKWTLSSILWFSHIDVSTDPQMKKEYLAKQIAMPPKKWL